MAKKTYVLNITDQIRLDIGSYWVDDNFLGIPNDTSLLNISYTPKVYDHATLQTKQGITLTPKVHTFKNPLNSGGPSVVSETFEEYALNLLASLATTNGFRDTVFINKIPEVTIDFSTSTDPVAAHDFSVNEEFLINFLGTAAEKKYEDAASDPSVSELSLINFYSATVQGVDADGDLLDDDLQLIQAGSFLEDHINKVLPTDRPQYENVIFPMDSLDELMALNVYANLYPLENIVSPYNAPGSNRFYNVLNDSNLDLALINSTMLYGTRGVTSNLPTLERTFQITERTIGGEKINSTENKFLLNVGLWADDVVNIIDWQVGKASNNKIYLAKTNNSLVSIGFADNNIGTPDPRIDSALTLLEGLTRIAEDNGLRSFEEINSGAKSFSKIVFYKIEKRSDPNSLRPIQTFWIPNKPDSDKLPIEYIDTQIKFNKNYFYSVFAYNMVVSTDYYYDVAGLQKGCPVIVPAGEEGLPVDDHQHTITNWSVGNAINHDDIHRHEYIADSVSPPPAGYTLDGQTGTSIGAGAHQSDPGNPHSHLYRVNSDGNGTTICANDPDFDVDNRVRLDTTIYPDVNQDDGGGTAGPPDGGDSYEGAAKYWNGGGGKGPAFDDGQEAGAAGQAFGGNIGAGYYLGGYQANSIGGVGGANPGSTGKIGKPTFDTAGETETGETAGGLTPGGDGATPGKGEYLPNLPKIPASGDDTPDAPSGGTELEDPEIEAIEAIILEVITTPVVDLIETHLFDFDGAIVSDPTIAPDVFFIPYIGIDNRITLSMQALIGEYKNRAVILDSTDADYIDTLRNARGLGPNDLITYKSDDLVAGFEIYRTETKPTSYEDFTGKFRDSISTLQRSSFEYIYAWDTAYKDKIVPNTTYYYMVRAVDVHGARSFPSSVFQVQMVNDGGSIYPLIRVIDLVPKPKPQTKTKNFKKFLQLVPAIAQKMINYEESELSVDGKIVDSATKQKGKTDGIALGVTVPKLFGKEDSPKIIKIRLISKSSGKKLDLNVAFKVENEK